MTTETKKKVAKKVAKKKATKKVLTEEQKAEKARKAEEKKIEAAKKREQKKWEAAQKKHKESVEKAAKHVDAMTDEFEALCKKYKVKAVMHYSSDAVNVQGTVTSKNLSNFEAYGIVKLVGPKDL